MIMKSVCYCTRILQRKYMCYSTVFGRNPHTFHYILTIANGDTAKINSFRSYISNYNRGSMTSEQLIDAFFALFSETSSNALGTLVREVADLFEDKKKAKKASISCSDVIDPRL